MEVGVPQNVGPYLLPAALGHQSSFTTSVSSVWQVPPLIPSIPAVGGFHFPFSLLPVHQTPRETASTVHASGWLLLTVGSTRLGSILSHTTLQARLTPPGLATFSVSLHTLLCRVGGFSPAGLLAPYLPQR